MNNNFTWVWMRKKHCNVDIHYTSRKWDMLDAVKNGESIYLTYCHITIIEYLKNKKQIKHNYTFKDIIDILISNKKIPKYILWLFDYDVTHPELIDLITQVIKNNLNIDQLERVLKANPTLLEVFI